MVNGNKSCMHEWYDESDSGKDVIHLVARVYRQLTITASHEYHGRSQLGWHQEPVSWKLYTRLASRL
jgi:hypothetical protein